MPVIGLPPPGGIAVLVGVSAALVVFGLVSEVRRIAAARRIARFVGRPPRPPVLALPALEPRWHAQLLQRALGASAATVRRALLTGVAVALGFAMLSGSAVAFALAGMIGLVVLVAASRPEAEDRIERQMPAAIRLMAVGLRAGLSVPQAMALVAKESPEPTASEFARARQEIDLGFPLDEALGRLAARTTSDYALVSTIVSVQREVGGNLAVILDEVAETLRERAELRQYAEAMTAQQRLSSLILTALPIVVFLCILVVNPVYMQPLLASFMGRFAILLGAALLFVGWTAMQWIGGTAGRRL